MIATVPDGVLVASGVTKSKKVVGSVDIASEPVRLKDAVAFNRLLLLTVTVVPLGIPLPLMSASRIGISR